MHRAFPFEMKKPPFIQGFDSIDSTLSLPPQGFNSIEAEYAYRTEKQ